MPTRQRRTLLIDQISPTWDVRERHQRSIKAGPEAAFDSMRTVTPDEVRLLRGLFQVRTFPSRLIGSAPVEPPSGQPLFDLLIESGFTILTDATPDEIVVGQIAKFWQLSNMPIHPVENVDDFIAFDEPGWCKATMNIRCRPEPGGSRIMTETRVTATTPGARHKLRVYWAIVLPGSAIIRRNWLAAAARKAEGTHSL
ncbi:hypothetical protein BH23CHL2_BH23CHL2_14150 [soil metagenome]